MPSCFLCINSCNNKTAQYIFIATTTGRQHPHKCCLCLLQLLFYELWVSPQRKLLRQIVNFIYNVWTFLHRNCSVQIKSTWNICVHNYTVRPRLHTLSTSLLLWAASLNVLTERMNVQFFLPITVSFTVDIRLNLTVNLTDTVTVTLYVNRPLEQTREEVVPCYLQCCFSM